MKSIIAPNVKRIIKEKGLKHKHIADKAGYSENQFSSMLNGRKVVADSDVLRIAEALDVSVSKLFQKEGENR